MEIVCAGSRDCSVPRQLWVWRQPARWRCRRWNPTPAWWSSSQHYASEVGAAVLRQGGNAIDAAVAVGYALAVTHPCCGNLGGGGFMVIHLADGRNSFINFRERAPLAATRQHVPRRPGQRRRRQEPQWLSGRGHARHRAGAGNRAPEVRHLARASADRAGDPSGRAGLYPHPRRCRRVCGRQRGLSQVSPMSRAMFLRDRAPLQPGDRLVQKDLARTLRAISERRHATPSITAPSPRRSWPQRRRPTADC